jgi:hypothetical protein
LGNFNPIAPRKAAELVDMADLGDASAVLADFAVAGLIKAYARIIETVDAGGTRAEVRDSRIPRDLWRRICNEGKVADIWATGSVRLSGSDLRGGMPSVSLIGIRFDDKSLQTVISQHGGPIPAMAKDVDDADAAPATPAAAQVQPVPEAAAIVPSSAAPAAVPTKRVPQGLPEGAVMVTVAQAEAATGLGRTTIDKLMKAGTLIRVKVGSRTLITVESIRALIATET